MKKKRKTSEPSYKSVATIFVSKNKVRLNTNINKVASRVMLSLKECVSNHTFYMYVILCTPNKWQKYNKVFVPYFFSQMIYKILNNSFLDPPQHFVNFK